MVITKSKMKNIVLVYNRKSGEVLVKMQHLIATINILHQSTFSSYITLIKIHFNLNTIYTKFLKIYGFLNPCKSLHKVTLTITIPPPAPCPYIMLIVRQNHMTKHNIVTLVTVTNVWY